MAAALASVHMKVRRSSILVPSERYHRDRLESPLQTKAMRSRCQTVKSQEQAGIMNRRVQTDTLYPIFPSMILIQVTWPKTSQAQRFRTVAKALDPGASHRQHT